MDIKQLTITLLLSTFVVIVSAACSTEQPDVILPAQENPGELIQQAEAQLAQLQSEIDDLTIRIVPADSTLAEDGGTLTLGWYKGQDVSYFDFGMNPPDTAPNYVFITGFDGDDNPQFVEGQQNVIGVIPGDVGYGAFWQVNLVMVPADQVQSSGYEIATSDMVVNCPVLRTGVAAPASPTTLP